MSHILCLAGLGNIGEHYADHRHNVGAQLIAFLAHAFHQKLELHQKSRCLHTIIQDINLKIHLIIPQCYMNESGTPIKNYLDFYKIDPQGLIVAHDELDFQPGVLRFKMSGGHGGHNGLRNIHQQIGSESYKRIRIGIGHPGDKSKVASYVLSRPSRGEEDLVRSNFQFILENWNLIKNENWSLLIQILHSKIS